MWLNMSKAWIQIYSYMFKRTINQTNNSKSTDFDEIAYNVKLI